MQFFPSVKGSVIQLCVFTARDQTCTQKDCQYSHKPKGKRPCLAFHTLGDYCKDDKTCLLETPKLEGHSTFMTSAKRYPTKEVQPGTSTETVQATDQARSGWSGDGSSGIGDGGSSRGGNGGVDNGISQNPFLTRHLTLQTQTQIQPPHKCTRPDSTHRPSTNPAASGNWREPRTNPSPSPLPGKSTSERPCWPQRQAETPPAIAS